MKTPALLPYQIWTKRLALVFILSLHFSAAAATLDQKVEAQWSRMLELRNQIAQRADAAKTTGVYKDVSEVEWRQALTVLNEEMQLDSIDLQALHSLHSQIEAVSFKKALEASQVIGIDLDQFRTDATSVDRFCRDLPKGGMLHVHTYGTMDRNTVASILSSVNPEIERSFLIGLKNGETPGFRMEAGRVDRFLDAMGNFEKVRFSSLNELQRRLFLDFFFMEQGPYDFDHFMGIFKVVFEYFFTNKNVKPADLVWEAFLKRAQEQKISYVEVTQNLKGTSEALAQLEKSSRLYEERSRAGGTPGVWVRILGAIDRMAKADLNFQSVLKWLSLPKSGIFLGVNLVAEELNFPARQSQGAYGLLLAGGGASLRRSAHAGELGDVHNVRDALILGVERIGHGVKVVDDPVTLDLLRRTSAPTMNWERQIAARPVSIEINLTSNLKLGVVKDLRSHPWLRFLRLGIPVSLSTDDEGIFETDLSQECARAIAQSNVTYAELRQVMLNSLETSFEPESSKSELLERLRKQLVDFEARWRVH